MHVADTRKCIGEMLERGGIFAFSAAGVLTLKDFGVGWTLGAFIAGLVLGAGVAYLKADACNPKPKSPVELALDIVDKAAILLVVGGVVLICKPAQTVGLVACVLGFSLEVGVLLALIFGGTGIDSVPAPRVPAR